MPAAVRANARLSRSLLVAAARQISADFCQRNTPDLAAQTNDVFSRRARLSFTQQMNLARKKTVRQLAPVRLRHSCQRL